MSNKAKIGWVYLLTALFIAISLFFVVKSRWACDGPAAQLAVQAEKDKKYKTYAFM